MKKHSSMLFILNEINEMVEKHLCDNSIKPRNRASQGLWLCMLLPLCVIRGCWIYPNCSYLYRTATCLSVGLLLSSLTFTFLIKPSTQIRTTCVVINSITTTLLINYFSDHGLLFAFLFGSIMSLSFNRLILWTLKTWPECFTFGEAALAVEAAIIFFSSVVTSPLFSSDSASCVDVSTKILQVGITCIAVLIGWTYALPRLRNTTEFYIALAVSLVAIVVILHVILGFSAVIWIVNLVFEDSLSVQMVAVWVLLTVTAVAATVFQVTGGQKASTVVRKYFHLLALFVYLPGLLLKPCLLFLASGIVFAAFLVLELVRVLKVPPAAAALDSVFQVFADDKDSSLALTPIYLLVGCSLPLWLHPAPVTEAPLLPLLAGLLSVAIGDTAASTCGSWVGRHHWPGSNKTKEGTAACFISQLFFVIALIHFEYVPRDKLLQPIAAITTVTWVEATTDQIDNIALPLLMYAILL